MDIKALMNINEDGVESIVRLYRLVTPIMVYFRTKRMRQFRELFKITNESRILDIGGTSFMWSLIPTRPRLTILNLFMPTEVVEKNITWIVSDGRKLQFKNNEFDIVYSNSVIEHLTDRASQEAFAKEIARVGISYYVQTPNRWFPIEPHFMTPFIHFLSKSWQKRLVKNFTVWGLLGRPTTQHCEEYVEELRLLDYQTMRQLFPDAQILREKFLGLTKSLIAVRLESNLVSSTSSDSVSTSETLKKRQFA